MNTISSLYEHDAQPIPEGVEVPGFVHDPSDGMPPSTHDLAAILQGGCASGAWMPAVTYWAARQIMNDDGDAVMDYIEDAGFSPRALLDAEASWSNWAVSLVSNAVEIWAASVADEVADLLDQAAEEDQAEEDGEEGEQ